MTARLADEQHELKAHVRFAGDAVATEPTVGRKLGRGLPTNRTPNAARWEIAYSVVVEPEVPLAITPDASSSVASACSIRYAARRAAVLFSRYVAL